MAAKIDIVKTWTERYLDKYKESFGAAPMSEKTAMAPAKIKGVSKARKGKNKGHEGIVANCSEIHIESNTVAVIYSNGKIDQILTTPGTNKYYAKEPVSLDTPAEIMDVALRNKKVFSFLPEEEKRIAFINLRPLRGIGFGTGIVPYHDKHYNLDLEVRVYGTFAIQITNPARFVENFVPAGVYEYVFDSKDTVGDLNSDIKHSMAVAVASMSENYRILDMTASANELLKAIKEDAAHVGAWEAKYGFKMVSIVLEGISYTDASQLLIDEYNTKRVPFIALENTTEESAQMAIKSTIASAFQKHGFGGAVATAEVPASQNGMAVMNNVTPFVAPASTVDVAGMVTALTSDSKTDKFEKKIVMIERLAALRENNRISQEVFDKLLKEVV